MQEVSCLIMGAAFSLNSVWANKICDTMKNFCLCNFCGQKIRNVR